MHILRSALRAGFATLTLFLFVGVAHAQVPDTKGVDNLGVFLLKGIYFIDRYLVPVIFALAFIVFVIGVYRFFIAGATNEEKRQEGQKFVVYGLVGFVLMLSVWGIVNLLLNTLGFNRTARPDLPIFGAPTDYMNSTKTSLPTSNTKDTSNTTNSGTPDNLPNGGEGCTKGANGSFTCPTDTTKTPTSNTTQTSGSFNYGNPQDI
ncbi:MAG: pilin [Bacillota bacterium]